MRCEVRGGFENFIIIRGRLICSWVELFIEVISFVFSLEFLIVSESVRIRYFGRVSVKIYRLW